jgi:hypothetical protein
MSGLRFTTFGPGIDLRALEMAQAEALDRRVGELLMRAQVHHRGGRLYEATLFGSSGHPFAAATAPDPIEVLGHAITLASQRHFTMDRAAGREVL